MKRIIIPLLLLMVGVDAGAQAPAAPSREAVLKAAREIAAAAGICAVITIDEAGQPQARAIDIFQPDDRFVVWFATNPKSRKVAHITKNPRVTVYCYDTETRSYATVLGRARLVNEPAEKQRRWKKSFEAFWPDRGEGYLLVEVTPVRVEVSSPSRGVGNDPLTWAPRAVDFETRTTR
jgi:general stress protein 26